MQPTIEMKRSWNSIIQKTWRNCLTWIFMKIQFHYSSWSLTVPQLWSIKLRLVSSLMNCLCCGSRSVKVQVNLEPLMQIYGWLAINSIQKNNMSRGEVESAIITSINAHQNSISVFASQNPSHKIICWYYSNNKRKHNSRGFYFNENSIQYYSRIYNKKRTYGTSTKKGYGDDIE